MRKWAMCCLVEAGRGEANGRRRRTGTALWQSIYDGREAPSGEGVAGALGSDRQFTGISYLYYDFLEVGTGGAAPTDAKAKPDVWARTEHVPGAFLETTWTGHPRGMVVAGLRVDQHNLWGTIVTPRLHARWSATEQTSLKMVAGTGFRTQRVDGGAGGVGEQPTWMVDGPSSRSADGTQDSTSRASSSLAIVTRIRADGYWTEFKTARSSTLTRTPTRSAFTTSAIGSRVP